MAIDLPQGNGDFPEEEEIFLFPGLTDDLGKGLDAPLVADFSQNIRRPHSGGCHRMMQGPCQFIEIAELIEGLNLYPAFGTDLFILPDLRPAVRTEENQG